jgi:hypothetical protein
MKIYNDIAKTSNDPHFHYNLAISYMNGIICERNLELAEELCLKVIEDGKMVNIEDVYRTLFIIKKKSCQQNEEKDTASSSSSLISYCLQCAEKGQLWAMEEYSRMCWKRGEYKNWPLVINKTNGVNRMEQGFKWLQKIVESERERDHKESNCVINTNSKALLVRNGEILVNAMKILNQGDYGIISTILDVCSPPTQSNLTPESVPALSQCDFEFYLKHVKDVQFVLSSILHRWLSTLTEGYNKTGLVAYFVYHYGLDWRYFYSKFPIVFTYSGEKEEEYDDQKFDIDRLKKKNYLNVEIQNRSLLELYRHMKSTLAPTLSNDIFNLIGQYIPWFTLVAEQCRLLDKKRKSAF